MQIQDIFEGSALFPAAHNITCVTNRRVVYKTDISGFRLLHRAIMVSTNLQEFLEAVEARRIRVHADSQYSNMKSFLTILLDDASKQMSLKRNFFRYGFTTSFPV